MKILLVQPIIFSDKWAGALPVLPLGAMIICNALEKNNIEYKFLDFCFENINNMEQKCKDIMQTFIPDCIGYSIRNIDTTLLLKPIFFLDNVKRVIEMIRKYQPAACKEIVGGAGFSIMPEKILSFLNIDYGIIGEGEESFIELLKKFEKKRIPTSVNSLIYKKGKDIFVKTKRNFISKLDEYGNMKFANIDKRYFELRNTNMGLQRCSVNIQTKRGCRFNCSYCIYPEIEGKEIRFFPVPGIVDNIIRIKNTYNINSFEIVDSIFNEPKEFSVQFCKELIGRNCRMQWTANFRPVGFTDDYVSLLKEAGCHSIEIGADAVEESLISTLNKPFKREDLDNTLNLLNKYNMHYLLYIIIGAPADDDEKIRKTLEYLEKYHVRNILLFFGIRIYPGTGIYKHAASKGIITKNSDLLHPAFYFSEQITIQCMETIRKYQEKNRGWIFVALDTLDEYLRGRKHE